MSEEPRGGISHQREVNTGVATVKRQHTHAGMRAELAEIQSHLGNTASQPLNKTEYERLRRRKRTIERRLKGRDPRFSVLKGRSGSPKECEVEPFAIKSAACEILNLLEGDNGQ